jgi:tetratricopeptide (TPR) repeat protein
MCRYGQGDLNAAEEIFRDATLKFPDEGVLFNNLAQVLMDQGRKREAREAAMRAVELGGPLKAHFENTFEDDPQPLTAAGQATRLPDTILVDGRNPYGPAIRQSSGRSGPCLPSASRPVSCVPSF